MTEVYCQFVISVNNEKKHILTIILTNYNALSKKNVSRFILRDRSIGASIGAATW